MPWWGWALIGVGAFAIFVGFMALWIDDLLHVLFGGGYGQ